MLVHENIENVHINAKYAVTKWNRADEWNAPISTFMISRQVTKGNHIERVYDVMKSRSVEQGTESKIK